MKALYFLIPMFMIGSCKTQPVTVTSTDNVSMGPIDTASSDCPEDGKCTVEVQPNMNLQIKEDGTGALYPEMVTGENSVVVYTFLREGPPGTADGNYSETIHIEIPADTQKLSKENAALGDVKVLYGKHCFCKGEAGYYPVTDGKLTINRNRLGLVIDLKFKINKTSQVITHISEVVRL
ncbi:hypothetical protein QRD02_10085 [Aequorivita sp. SDUM287046]|uniref:Lipoprotein n=1 Tax=Aequorivita aurantiaca TaxID=3053356 RepID=A0ABT8DNB3_9FLAO|nr:hypothetical protein [Aequorivita aurantiaca]MDN3724733.1 hypothetical protein [Aequorivita aurantiaca]